jgi:tetratricopeptide (TPR) repeat protein
MTAGPLTDSALGLAAAAMPLRWGFWWSAWVVGGAWMWLRLRGGTGPAERRLGELDWALLLAGVSIQWWLALSGLNAAGAASLANTSLAAFAIGSLLGFVFTAYGEETASIGKIRDYIVAGVVSLGIAEAAVGFGHVNDLLKTLAPKDAALGPYVGAFIIYSALGFYCLFILRETAWNPLFAERRIARLKLEQEALALIKALSKADAETPTRAAPGEVTPLDPAVSQDVSSFILNAEFASKKGVDLPPGVQGPLGLAYFYKRDYEKAIPHLEAQLRESPSAEIATKLAVARAGKYGERAAIEVLDAYQKKHPGAPDVLRALGYYLLWDRTRLADAVMINREYLRKAPKDDGATFNLACAYAQLHEGATDPAQKKDLEEKAIATLAAAITINPAWKGNAERLAKDPDGDFRSLRGSEAFRALVGT